MDPRGAASGRRQARTALAWCSLALAGLAAAVWWTVAVRADADIHDGAHMLDRAHILIGTGACWVVSVGAWLLLRRAERHGASAREVGCAVVVGLLVAGAAALVAPPSTSNDSARYAWDGMVQKAGISPYRDVPAADSLASLRPSWLFAARTDGAGSACAEQFPTGDVLATSVPRGVPLCTAINRPQVPTAYPPAAEVYFLLVRLPLPSDVSWLAFQIGGIILALAVALTLLGALRRSGSPLSTAALWAWSPLVLLEAVNNAHVDALSAALLLGAALLVVRRPGSSGVLFGLAVATKVIPAVALPGMLRKKPWRFTVAAGIALIASYVPYVILSGPAVIGYLPGYLSEEGYASGDSTRFSLPGIFLPPFPALLVGGAALLAVWAWVWHRRNSLAPLGAQTLAVGWALIIVCPSYAWYGLMLVPLALLARRPEFLVVAPALEAVTATVGTDAGPLVSRVAMATAAAVVLLVGLRRSRAGASLRPARRSRPGPRAQA